MQAGGSLCCCCFLKKGAGCGEEEGEEIGAGLLKDSMSCAQCIRKVLKTAKAPHQTHTTAKQHSVHHRLQRGSLAPPTLAHHIPPKKVASPQPVPHASTPWPRWQCSHPGAHTPGPMTSPNHPWYVQVYPPHGHPTPEAKRGPAQTFPLPPISFLPVAPFQVEMCCHRLQVMC